MKGYLKHGRFHYLLANDVLANEVVDTPFIVKPFKEPADSASTHVALPPAASISLDTRLFDHDHCMSLDGAYRITEGRGTSVVFPAYGRQLFLKDYRRGGMVRHLSQDRYLYTGLDRTRAWREFRLLEMMKRSGLAVPQPFACRVERLGVSYRARLIVEVIDNGGSLAELVKTRGFDAVDWYSLGEFIGGFGRQQIFHADLNASNILMVQGEVASGGGVFYLIDFDRGRKLSGLSAPLFRYFYQQRMLQRLYRSLVKTANMESAVSLQPGWQEFLSGYTHNVKRS